MITNELSWLTYLVGLLVLVLIACPQVVGGNVAPIDLMRHEPNDKVKIRQLCPGEYEWSLPDGLSQSLHIDLNKLGIKPADFDEFRFDLKPEGSLVFLQAMIRGFPEAEDVSSWYSKFNTRVGEWTEGRYDLRVDDDGAYLYMFRSGLSKEPEGRFTLTLSRQELGLPGEPSWRKAHIRNPRFIRYPVSVKFQLAECEIVTEGAEVSYTYCLHLKNRTEKSQTVLIDADSRKTLKYFRVAVEKQLTLKPGESRDVKIRLYIARAQAMCLPALYAEPLTPKVSVKNIPDSDVVPLMGYRLWPMWGVVPIFNRVSWTPATFQAFLNAREKAMPKIANWRRKNITLANNALKYNWPMPKNMLPRHPSVYRCRDKKCLGKLYPVDPMKFHKHYCSKCKKIYENDRPLDQAHLFYYYGRRCKAIRVCALAWLITGEKKYAEKAKHLFLSFAKAYPSLPVYNERSTSGATKFGFNSLMSSYVLPVLAEGYCFLNTYTDLNETQRKKIEAMLNDEALRIARHCVLYSNMTAEHFRAYGSTGIATGFWPMAGEAIYAEFGWHKIVERGFTEEGIAHEAGGYHRAIFHAMDEFASFALGQNVNLYTARFKRVFDGSLTVGGSYMISPYETAYAVWRDPSYLGILEERRRKGVNDQAVFHGILGLASAKDFPVKSAHMEGTGYIFLRKGNAADSYEIRLNYIKYFDRTEYDKFCTFFSRNGKAVETLPGRMSYGDVNSKFMYATAAHNAIVIDGKDERPADGRLVVYNPDPETPIAVVETNPEATLYKGVQQLRAIALIENNYIVFDAIRCDKPHTIDRYQYGRGKALVSCALKPVSADFPCLPHPEFKPIEQVASGPCGKQVELRFKDDFTMTLVSENNLEICKGLTHGGYQGQPMEVTFARAANATTASFFAAFTWGKEPPPPTLRIIKNSPDEILLEIKIVSRIYKIQIKPKLKSAEVKSAKR